MYGKNHRKNTQDITRRLQQVGFKANFISGLMMPISMHPDLTYLLVAVIGAIQVSAGCLTVKHAGLSSDAWQNNQPIQNLSQLAEPCKVPNLHWIVSSKSLMNQM